MRPQAYQTPEIRDENDFIIQQGTFGKKTPFVNSQNDGILDYIINNLEAIKGVSLAATIVVSSLPSTGQAGKFYLLDDGTENSGKVYIYKDKWIEVTTQAEGLSAYQVAKKNGYEGTEQEWLENEVYGDDIVSAETDSDGYFIVHTRQGKTIKTALKPLVDAKASADKAKISETNAAKSAESASKSAVEAAQFDPTMYPLKAYKLSLAGLDINTFYPVVFAESQMGINVEVHSPTYPGGDSNYNQNVLAFRCFAGGWNDGISKKLEIKDYFVYNSDEITIGCLGVSTRNGGACLWLRGGLKSPYRIMSTVPPTLYENGWKADNGEVATIGSTYKGAETGNAYIDIMFTPKDIPNKAAKNVDFETYGLFEKAEKDSAGNVIKDFYMTKNDANSLKAQIPTKTSQLTNDSKFAKLNEIFPITDTGRKIIEEEGLTDLNSIQCVSYPSWLCRLSATIPKLSHCPTATAFFLYNMRSGFSSDKETLPNLTRYYYYIVQLLVDINGDVWKRGAFNRSTSTFTFTDWKKLAITSDLPTKTSQLTNDSGFATINSSGHLVINGSELWIE